MYYKIFYNLDRLTKEQDFLCKLQDIDVIRVWYDYEKISHRQIFHILKEKEIIEIRMEDIQRIHICSLMSRQLELRTFPINKDEDRYLIIKPYEEKFGLFFNPQHQHYLTHF